jgi:hypothetical protein
MANEDHNENHVSRRLTAREVNYLADRMLARGVSAFFEANRQIKADMLVCSACLRVLASEHPDGVEVDVWRLMP